MPFKDTFETGLATPQSPRMPGLQACATTPAVNMWTASTVGRVGGCVEQPGAMLCRDDFLN